MRQVLFRGPARLRSRGIGDGLLLTHRLDYSLGLLMIFILQSIPEPGSTYYGSILPSCRKSSIAKAADAGDPPRRSLLRGARGQRGGHHRATTTASCCRVILGQLSEVGALFWSPK